MKSLRTLTVVAGILAGSLGVQVAPALAADAVKAKNVVLVHGAWADGSSWAQVIPKLQAAGLHVTAVQNPLTSLADSVAETRRVLAQQDGPTVLVAHSWGGTVISEVGTDPKVTGLVYIAARAPDAGEDFVALSQKFPAGPARAGVQEHDGFTKLSEDAFLKYFANGVDPPDRESPLRRAMADRGFHFRRPHHRGCVAQQAELVCRVEAGLHDQSRPRAVSGQADECHDGRTGCRPPVAGLAAGQGRRPDPGRRRCARIARWLQ